ncbi:unnamed protein product [Withania somnifera]
MVKDKENSSDSGNKVKENKYEENNLENLFGGKEFIFLENRIEIPPSCQELTFSYLCENSKLGFQEKDVDRSYKGKQVMEESSINRWVERDFLQMNEISRGNGNSSKRDAEDEGENREKKPKIETLKLSLALPDVSLSLAGSNRFRPSRSLQSLDNNNTHSIDVSLSCSNSHHVSHNPSCSLTWNSTEYSVGRGSDHIWNCGEGTNGSVHSRFRAIGDGGVAFANNSFPLCSQVLNKETCMHKAASPDNLSFFPSELPARPTIDGQDSESLKGLESRDGGRSHKISRPERILREIVSESIPLMAQIVQELPGEIVESAKEYLRSLIVTPDRKDELVVLQNRLNRRCDLTNETLAKCHKTQLELFVAIKLGLGSFLSSKKFLSTTELVDIFLLERCRNINCMRVLPVEDCECKICSTKKGFCSECMCPICLNFDCANNTCSWVGCDACSHWCHAVCGIQRSLIKPGPSFKGTTEMQFYCLGCGHASEMFGFVKDVFTSCASDWGEETLMKELDCVQKIFQGSEDFKEKKLHVKADELRSKLEKKMISRADVCNFILQFFNYTEGLTEFPSSNFPDKDFSSQAGPRQDVSLPASTCFAPKSSLYNTSTSSGRNYMVFDENQQKDVKASFMPEKMVEDEWSVKQLKKDELDSLESIVRIKEAEARMFQNRADDARREAESFRRVTRMNTEKLDDEYSEKLARLCLQETEERRRKKLEELKVLENSHCDYYKMKMRMESEITGLLKRMEATKQLWV